MITHKNCTLLVLSFWMLSTCIFAQDSTSYNLVFGNGVALYGGVGYFAVRDEFISSEKYSGVIPIFVARWSRFHETYGYRLALQYQHTSNLKNNNVSAEITQFSINLDFRYPIGKVPLLEKELHLFLGPSTELFFHFRRQNIAGSGESIFNAYSVASLMSAGLRLEVFCPISSNLQLNGSTQVSILSLGGRFLDPRKTDVSPIKLLSLFSGLNASGELGVHYRLITSLIASVAYRLEVTRISSWDYFISGSDFFIIGVSYEL